MQISNVFMCDDENRFLLGVATSHEKAEKMIATAKKIFDNYEFKIETLEADKMTICGCTYIF